MLTFLNGTVLNEAPTRWRVSLAAGPHSVVEVVAVGGKREAAGGVRARSCSRCSWPIKNVRFQSSLTKLNMAFTACDRERGVGGQRHRVGQRPVGPHAIDRSVQVTAAQQVAAPAVASTSAMNRLFFVSAWSTPTFIRWAVGRPRSSDQRYRLVGGAVPARARVGVRRVDDVQSSRCRTPSKSRVCL